MERNTISRKLFQMFAAAVREYKRVYPTADNLTMKWEDGQLVVSNNEPDIKKRILVWQEENGEVHMIDYDRNGNPRDNIIKKFHALKKG